MIRNLLAGEYSSPVRIIAFNTAEGWSPDVTSRLRRPGSRHTGPRSDPPLSARRELPIRLGRDDAGLLETRRPAAPDHRGGLKTNADTPQCVVIGRHWPTRKARRTYENT